MTPEDCSSDLRARDLEKGGWSDIPRYALKTLMLPNGRAREKMLLAIAKPEACDGAEQFSSSFI